MNAFFLFLGKNEVPIYLVLLLLGLFFFRELWRSWATWRQAYFSLEREFAMRKLAYATFLCALVLIGACGQTVVASFIVPGLPASDMLSTPTVDLLGAANTADTAGNATSLSLTPSPLLPAAGSTGCIKGQMEITSPKNGDTIKGSVDIIGTVDVPNFGFYKYEFASIGADLWATIAADRLPKKNETLGSWATGTLVPGDYQLRLVVTDTQGQVLPACVISVRVVGE